MVIGMVTVMVIGVMMMIGVVMVIGVVTEMVIGMVMVIEVVMIITRRR